jgi:hypothetical protein
LDSAIQTAWIDLLFFNHWGGWWVDVVEGGHTRLRNTQGCFGAGAGSVHIVRRAVIKQKHPSPAPLPPCFSNSPGQEDEQREQDVDAKVLSAAAHQKHGQLLLVVGVD